MKKIDTKKAQTGTKLPYGSAHRLKSSGHPVMAAIATGVSIYNGVVSFVGDRYIYECPTCGFEMEASKVDVIRNFFK